MSSTDGSVDIRPPILDGLARVARHIEADADLGDALALLFEQRGALLAMPLPPAAMLAEEIQRGCEILAYGHCADRRETREVLSLAVSQLANYLQRLHAGEVLKPVILLAAINDLRHCRGAAPSSAAELSSLPALLAQSRDPSAQSLQALARMAEKFRPHFHRYLVRWLNSGTPEAGLPGLARLFSHARLRFGQGSVHDLFLAAEGVVDGLIDGSIVADAAIKALILRLDKILRRLTAVPPEWPRGLAMAMIRDLVDVLAQSTPTPPALQELAHLHVRRLSEGLAQGTGADAEATQPQSPSSPASGSPAGRKGQGDATGGGVTRRGPPGGAAAAALRDARAGLRAIGSVLGSSERSGLGRDLSPGVAGSVRDVADALRGVGEPEAAAVLDRLSAELQRRFDDPGVPSGAVDRALMRRAVAAVEIHLEEQLERGEGDPRMLAEAGDALKRLSRPLPRDEDAAGPARSEDPLPLFAESQAIDVESLDLSLKGAQGRFEAVPPRPGPREGAVERDSAADSTQSGSEDDARAGPDTGRPPVLERTTDRFAALGASQTRLRQQNIRFALRLAQLADDLRRGEARADGGRESDGWEAGSPPRAGEPRGNGRPERSSESSETGLAGVGDLAALAELQRETAALLHRRTDLAGDLRQARSRREQHTGQRTPADDASMRILPTVLVVADAQTVQHFAPQLSRRERIRAAAEVDGVAARASLQKRPPDLLVLDLGTAVDGLALARHVRHTEKLKQLPIVMLSSGTGDDGRDAALAAGVDRYLTKPFDEEAMLSEIESALIPGSAPAPEEIR